MLTVPHTVKGFDMIHVIFSVFRLVCKTPIYREPSHIFIIVFFYVMVDLFQEGIYDAKYEAEHLVIPIKHTKLNCTELEEERCMMKISCLTLHTAKYIIYNSTCSYRSFGLQT